MRKMKVLMIILPLIVLMMVPLAVNAEVVDDFTQYVVSFDFTEDGIDGSDTYSDSIGGLELSIYPLFDNEIDAIAGDGIEFDKRCIPVDTITEVEGREIADMSAYTFKFNKRVKIHSYTIGSSTGVWNDETVEPDVWGKKTPNLLGIGSYAGLSADGPDYHDYGPDSEPDMDSVDHDISSIGIYGDSFKIYEDGRGIFGNFTIKSIQVVVAE